MTTDATDPVAHTPLPWRKIKGTGIIAASDCHVAKVGDFTDVSLLRFNRARWEADAALIVTACNSYHAMKEALEAIAGFGTVDLSAEWESGLRDIIRSCTDRARAALGNQVKT